MKKLYDFLWLLGEISGCHQMPQRSFFCCGRQFPVCARCTGAFVGYITEIFLSFIYRLPLWVDIMFCVIMFIDWFVQRIDWQESTNIRRIITGGICGIGLTGIYINVFNFVLSKIITYFI